MNYSPIIVISTLSYNISGIFQNILMVEIQDQTLTYPSPFEFFEAGNFSIDRIPQSCYKIQNLYFDQFIN